jgi:type II secretory pathway component PulF
MFPNMFKVTLPNVLVIFHVFLDFVKALNFVLLLLVIFQGITVFYCKNSMNNQSYYNIISKNEFPYFSTYNL